MQDCEHKYHFWPTISLIWTPFWLKSGSNLLRASCRLEPVEGSIVGTPTPLRLFGERRERAGRWNSSPPNPQQQYVNITIFQNLEYCKSHQWELSESYLNGLYYSIHHSWTQRLRRGWLKFHESAEKPRGWWESGGVIPSHGSWKLAFTQLYSIIVDVYRIW